MHFLYNLSVWGYAAAIRVAALWNPKARLWVRGRQNWETKLKTAVAGGDNWVWFHAASLGEFEQGRPLLERFAEEWPEYRILLTFFSPSGYEIRHNYEGADYVCYLPTDRHANVNRFIELVNPKAVFFIKYEFWFNYLGALRERNVPLFLVSGIFRPDHHFFRPSGGWAQKQLKAFTHFFLQDQASAKLLKSIGLSNFSVVGDTRFDRVIKLIEPGVSLPMATAFAKGARVLVAGSTWPTGEAMLAKLVQSNSWPGKMLIAPHQVDEAHIEQLMSRFGAGTQRWSTATVESVVNCRVLIVDRIGLLGRLYAVAEVAYVGGGFGAGIHNVLEAAVHGKFVLFGPVHQKFLEARGLLETGGGASFSNYEELVALLNDTDASAAGAAAATYVASLVGATEAVMAHLAENWKEDLKK